MTYENSDSEAGPDAALEAEVAKWVADQSHYPRQLIARVTHFNGPGWDNEQLRASVKALIEIHPKHFEGPSSSFCVAKDGRPGSEKLEHPHYAPRFTYGEKYGKAIERCAVALGKATLLGANFDMVILEPDATGKKIVSAWKLKGAELSSFTGHAPRRDLVDDVGHPYDVYLQFTGDTVSDEEVDAEAQAILDKIVLTGANPYQPSKLPHHFHPNVVSKLAHTVIDFSPTGALPESMLAEVEPRLSEALNSALDSWMINAVTVDHGRVTTPEGMHMLIPLKQRLLNHFLAKWLMARR